MLVVVVARKSERDAVARKPENKTRVSISSLRFSTLLKATQQSLLWHRQAGIAATRVRRHQPTNRRLAHTHAPKLIHQSARPLPGRRQAAAKQHARPQVRAGCRRHRIALKPSTHSSAGHQVRNQSCSNAKQTPVCPQPPSRRAANCQPSFDRGRQASTTLCTPHTAARQQAPPIQYSCCMMPCRPPGHQADASPDRAHKNLPPAVAAIESAASDLVSAAAAATTPCSDSSSAGSPQAS